MSLACSPAVKMVVDCDDCVFRAMYPIFQLPRNLRSTRNLGQNYALYRIALSNILKWSTYLQYRTIHDTMKHNVTAKIRLHTTTIAAATYTCRKKTYNAQINVSSS